MSRLSRFLTLASTTAVLVMGSGPKAQAISFTPFGPNGAGGVVNGQSLSVGAGGEVFELDAFLSLDGATSLRLSTDSLPSGLDSGFTSSLSGDATDLALSYRFTNNTGAVINTATFVSFLDADIDFATNGFFNEFAFTSGAPGAGQSWEIDEPGFVFGDIQANIAAASLDGTNAVPASSPDDVSMALALQFDEIAIGSSFGANVMISEDLDSLGGIAITQTDPDSAVSTFITFSQVAAVPEPGSALLMAIGMPLVGLASRRKLPPAIAV